VFIDAIADMTTTGIALKLGIPEKNRLPRWVFNKFGRVRGPIIYTPLEILIVYGCLSIAYNLLLAPWGQETAASLVFYIAIILTASVIVNNTTKLLLKWSRLRRAPGQDLVQVSVPTI
jgi:hypothetical protein